MHAISIEWVIIIGLVCLIGGLVLWMLLTRSQVHVHHGQQSPYQQPPYGPQYGPPFNR